MASKKKRAPAKGAVPQTGAPVAFIPPMAAHLVAALPEGDEWLYEVKLDGFRALVMKDGASIELRSRRDNDLTITYPSVIAAARTIPVEKAVIDGEIVSLDPSGRPSLRGLQHRGALHGHRIVFFAFDLLHLNGIDLTALPLVERQQLLAEATAGSGLLLSASLPGSPADIVKSVLALGLEGVIAKRKTSPYLPGERTLDWQKLKLEHQQELVIGGFRAVDRTIDALVVGYYDEQGELRFAGRVRAGFVPHTRRDVYGKLAPLQIRECPFVDLPTKGSSRYGGLTAEDMKEMRWVEPKLVAQIRFVDWTADGRLRESKFLGMRPDKEAAQVRREMP